MNINGCTISYLDMKNFGNIRVLCANNTQLVELDISLSAKLISLGASFSLLENIVCSQTIQLKELFINHTNI